MGKEVERALEKFLYKKEIDIRFFGNEKENILKFGEFLRNINLFNEPDLYAIVNNETLIIEHFEFDSTKNTKSGSELRKEFARIDRKIERIPFAKEGAFIHDELKNEHTAKYYIENAIKHFKNHYKKIDRYKENLINKGIIKKDSQVKTCFFIEDVTIFGNFMKVEEDYAPVILVNCDKFLDILEESKKIDYILCGLSFFNNDYLWFLSRSSINEYKKTQIDIENLNMENMKPQMVGFNMPIPKKNENLD